MASDTHIGYCQQLTTTAASTGMLNVPYVYPDSTPLYSPSFTFIPMTSKLEQAFTIVQKLMADDLIKCDTIQQFTDAVAKVKDCL